MNRVENERRAVKCEAEARQDMNRRAAKLHRKKREDEAKGKK